MSLTRYVTIWVYIFTIYETCDYVCIYITYMMSLTRYVTICVYIIFTIYETCDCVCVYIYTIYDELDQTCDYMCGSCNVTTHM